MTSGFYSDVNAALDMLGVDDRADVFNGVRFMELEALKAFAAKMAR